MASFLASMTGVNQNGSHSSSRRGSKELDIAYASHIKDPSSFLAYGSRMSTVYTNRADAVAGVSYVEVSSKLNDVVAKSEGRIACCRWCRLEGCIVRLWKMFMTCVSSGMNKMNGSMVERRVLVQYVVYLVGLLDFDRLLLLKSHCYYWHITSVRNNRSSRRPDFLSDNQIQ